MHPLWYLMYPQSRVNQNSIMNMRCFEIIYGCLISIEFCSLFFRMKHINENGNDIIENGNDIIERNTCSTRVLKQKK